MSLDTRSAASLGPPFLVPCPAGLADFDEGAYRVRFARDPADLEAVLRLRFEVFNRELGEGLGESWRTGLDCDRFDAVCHHLLIVERAGGAVVGTYRLQTAEQAHAGAGLYCAEARAGAGLYCAEARAGAGLYCAEEFDLAPLASIVAAGVELGRACIAREHRQGGALFALWRGLAAYLAWSQKRYLFGCCSLTSQDPRAGLALWRWLEREGYLWRGELVEPHADFACVEPPGAGFAPETPLPKLFGTYLRYGAQVVSRPALDRAFQTIDYLVVLDVRGLPQRLWRLFFSGLTSGLAGSSGEGAP